MTLPPLCKGRWPEAGGIDNPSVASRQHKQWYDCHRQSWRILIRCAEHHPCTGEPWDTPSVSEADSRNSGMIATGNHGDFDSLRGAQPLHRGASLRGTSTSIKIPPDLRQGECSLSKNFQSPLNCDIIVTNKGG